MTFHIIKYESLQSKSNTYKVYYVTRLPKSIKLLFYANERENKFLHY